MVKFNLPYPPCSGNHQHGHCRGRIWTRREIDEYRQQVGFCRIEQSIPMTEGWVSVVLDFWPPDYRRRDQDNVEKVLFDAMVHAGLIQDDSYVRRKLVEWREPEPPGRIEVRIQEYTL